MLNQNAQAAPINVGTPAWARRCELSLLCKLTVIEHKCISDCEETMKYAISKACRGSQAGASVASAAVRQEVAEALLAACRRNFSDPETLQHLMEVSVTGSHACCPYVALNVRCVWLTSDPPDSKLAWFLETELPAASLFCTLWWAGQYTVR